MEVFDNFPLSLVQQLVTDQAATGHPVAIGIDTRSRGFAPDVLLDTVRAHDAQMLFLTADEAVLQRRFTETRRRHPLAKDRPVSAGIRREMEWLHPLKAAAEQVIDTSDLSIHDLRRLLGKAFGRSHSARLTVTLLSFAFRHGLPREADIVLDARFLRNPHWEKSLRSLTGMDEKVRAYIAEDDAFEPFVRHIETLLEPLLPRYAQEGKSYLTIAFGCTGGKHRSVTLVEIIKLWIEDRGFDVNTQHRDIDRGP